MPYQHGTVLLKTHVYAICFAHNLDGLNVYKTSEMEKSAEIYSVCILVCIRIKCKKKMFFGISV